MTATFFSTLPHPLVIGHRGASGYAPDNSLAAFRLATEPGPTRCDGVELDIQVTRDGEFVVHHDPTLSTGEVISTLSLDRVRQDRLADGSSIPTLAESLEVLGTLQVFIEAKELPPEFDAALCALIGRDSRAARCHVHAFDHRIIARLHRRAPELSLGVLSCSYPINPVLPIREAGATVLWQESHLVDEALVATCGKAGFAVFAWTVNDVENAARLREIGVAGLCGNWPDRLGTEGMRRGIGDA